MDCELRECCIKQQADDGFRGDDDADSDWTDKADDIEWFICQMSPCDSVCRVDVSQ